LRRALVTGGHGFVGSHLAAGLLAAGVAVRVLDRPAPRQTDLGGPRASGLGLLGVAAEVELFEADLLDADAVGAAVASCDAVFHLAAQTIVGVASRAPAETFEVNVRGAWNVFEACREAAVERVVFASSDKAYGSSPELPYREDFPLRGAYPYDASKAAADTIARSYAAAYGMPVAVTRFANVYGGGDLNFTRLVPEVAIAVADRRAPAIRSDGSPKRDFLHVEDVVAAYLAIAAALERPEARGEAFNGGDEVEPAYGPGPPPGEIVDQYLDSTKLRELSGWRPRVELADGLARTLNWYREHPEARP
jgi:CDP-glucose 4,6-dehydratase